MNLRHCAFMAGLLLTFAAYGAERYPEVSNAEFAEWEQLLLVVEIEPGEQYELPICPPMSVCMDAAPFWFCAKVESIVAGSDVPTALRVSTRSHYGMKLETRTPGPHLMALRRGGDRYIMLRYAKWPLLRDRTGALYLPIESGELSSDLPCGIDSLRVEIYEENFANGALIASEKLKRRAKQPSSDFFVVSNKGAWPRFAVPIERLRQYLAKAGSDVKLSCPAPEQTD